MEKRTLPNFLIPGAQKGGTTFLFNVLSQHPEVCLSSIKEVHFFDIEENFARGLSYYSSFFDNREGRPAVGEATPSYLIYPHVAGRIREALGREVRLIFMLRHPVDRAFSHFTMSLAGMSVHEGLTVDDFPRYMELSFAKGAAAGFGPTGLYAGQLARFYGLFPRENSLVLLFEEDVRGDARPGLEKVCRFLGIAPHRFDPQARRNEAGVPKIKAVSRLIFDDASRVRRAARAFVRSPVLRDRLREKIVGMNLRPHKERLDPGLREELFRKYYEEDVARLEELLGRDLGCWRG
ncbi:MAG TPA: sulfotransferase [Pyrinomonadaceae bacterium]|nr:sulfotransferase [Pyrinomonadaceae bacterium]